MLKISESFKNTAVGLRKVTEKRNPNIEEIEIEIKGSKEKLPSDCTNRKIDLEECILANVSEEPSEFEREKYSKLLVARKKQFKKLLKDKKFSLTISGDSEKDNLYFTYKEEFLNKFEQDN